MLALSPQAGLEASARVCHRIRIRRLSILLAFVRRGCDGASESRLGESIMNKAMLGPMLLGSTLVLLGASAQGQGQQSKAPSYPEMAPVAQYLIAGTQEEIALARSAAPRSISAAATVLVLGKHGYETALKGSNGFVCFVERSWTAGFDDVEFWNPRVRAPNCFNPPAVRSVLPQYLERTEWVLAGIGRTQMIERNRLAMANGHFRVPEAGSFSFMLSKEGYLNDAAAGPWAPHVMFFLPYGEASAWGAGLEGSPVLGADGSKAEPTVLFIPVRRWSDNSVAQPATGAHPQDEPCHKHG